ncbi:MAG: hypothetical protein N4A33_10820 [Bacteriovoracaceae bacterium]|jgi:hypothetical protein|nr:hypothetical protein [Bacteriovoracaceae bacterium]
MLKNRKKLATLLVTYGLFANYAQAQTYSEKISPDSVEPLISLVQEKENKISSDTLSIWEGELSNRDTELIDELVLSKLYNPTNAEIFVRSLTEDDVLDLTNILEGNRIEAARQAVAATIGQ